MRGGIEAERSRGAPRDLEDLRGAGLRLSAGMVICEEGDMSL